MPSSTPSPTPASATATPVAVPSLVGKPAYSAPLVDTSGKVAREWLPWVQSLSTAASSLAALATAFNALQASVATGSTSASTVAAQVAAVQSALKTAQAALATLQTATGSLQTTVQMHTLEIGAINASLDAQGVFSLPASATQSGYLLDTDWVTFAAKQAALGYVPLNAADNLSDVLNVAAARANLGITGSGSGTGSGSQNQSIQVNGVGISDDYSWSVNQAPQITVNAS